MGIYDETNEVIYGGGMTCTHCGSTNTERETVNLKHGPKLLRFLPAKPYDTLRCNRCRRGAVIKG
jgi:hypothetical protein